ncbi:MAG: hypothetical protein FWB85_00475 [Chitinispirillia bacterium]|nr:hypothetical protein [Chitinispirillia bacterium]MCL2240937.1 hypothetical protein [Chitinispirillia bacterium]
MNKLSQKIIDDFLPHVKPDGRDQFKKSIPRLIGWIGEIVEIKDFRSEDGKRILRREYHGEHGGKVVLSAARAGVSSL